MAHIYPDNFEQKIGFDRIRKQLHHYCLSEMGKELVDEMSFTASFKKVDYLTELVREFLIILFEHDNFSTSYFFDLRKPLIKIRLAGTHLEEADLYDMKRSLETIRDIINFFNGENADKFPKLKGLTLDVRVFSTTIKAIDGIIDKNGKIKDNASSELAEIRRQIFSLQGSVSRKMQQIVRQLQKDGIVEEDATVSIREGRPVIPVLAANKRKLDGIVHDESASGKTAFIEPSEIVEMNNRLRVLFNAEKREIIKILLAFTDKLRPDVDELIAAYHFMGKIDFIRSKAKFAKDYECIKPNLRDEPFFDWHYARHPLLVQALKRENREVVPLKLRLDEPNRILLISGPNAGGKSVCLQTVGLLQYMLQCGMLMPIGDGARVGVFDSIFMDIGDEQSIDNDLSTYSSHLMNMKFFVKNCTSKSLVLIDEFGTGTEPMLGGAIAEAVLDKLNKLETYGIITTHYTNLKHFGASNKGIVNGAMLYDSKGMKPLFQLQIGKPGSSFAFEIARSIGLPEEILQDATAKLGKEHIDYDKNLREIVRDKQYWELKRNKIRQTEKTLDTLADRYEQELESTKQLRKEILDKARKDAQQLIDEANRTIENTIREIKESQAEKEKTKDLRKKLVATKDKFKAADPEEEAKLANKMKKLREREKNKANKKNKRKLEKPVISKPKLIYQPGDQVRIIETGNIAEIIDVDKHKVVLAFGELVSNTSIDKIEPLSNNEAKRSLKDKTRLPKKDSLARTNKLLESRLSFKPEIDIRGQRAEEAIGNIQAFIDEAVIVGAPQVKILHGKGFGILKEVIRNYLKTEPLVNSYKDEHVQFGGAGITVVELDN